MVVQKLGTGGSRREAPDDPLDGLFKPWQTLGSLAIGANGGSLSVASDRMDLDSRAARKGSLRVLVPRRDGRGWDFDQDRLSGLADDHAIRYREADPFPHLVLDGLFPDALLDDVCAQFPASDDPGWIRHREWRQHKLQWADPLRLPHAPRDLVSLLNSVNFIDFLNRLTGAVGLIADPYCFHGGLHAIEPGGYLKIHSDQTFQPKLWLQRHLNVIVFLNRDWDEAWGGGLEFWDPRVMRCSKVISPDFNRTVIFAAGLNSYHGHPDPIVAPAGTTRRSVALYYYTSPENPSSTGTKFEESHVRTRPFEKVDFHRLAVDVAPPIVLRGLRRLRNRFSA